MLAETQQAFQKLEAETEQLRKLCNELEEINRSQQDDLFHLGEARKQVQILYQDLQTRHHTTEVAHVLEKGERERLSKENTHVRAELARLQAEIRKVLREGVSDAALAEALTANEQLRKELAELQQTTIALRQTTDTDSAVRAMIEGHARELKLQLERSSKRDPSP